MKVKVRKIVSPYTAVPTASLQAILRNHAHDKLMVEIGTQRLYAIMEELANRREWSGRRFKTNEEAWEEFCNFYMPAERFEERHRRMPNTPHTLTPSPQGKECLGNGTWPGYECQCPDCDWFLICFPDECTSE